MIELINRARMNIPAEMSRYGLSDINEGLPAGTLNTNSKQPLAVNLYLTDAARTFTDLMLSQGFIGHEGPGGTTPQSRMGGAGYVFAAPYTTAENAGAIITGFPDKAERLHGKFFLDYENLYGGRGHRVQMLMESLKEIGVGFAQGTWSYNGNTYANTTLTTIDFAASGTTSFLTGVAFNDLSQDNFYTEGEGLAGVKITALRISDGKVFTTNTLDAGGYSLRLADGAYHIFASGGSLSGTIDYGNVSINGLNVKADFKPSMINSSTPPPTSDQPPPSNEPPFASVQSGVLVINGTDSAEVITVTYSSSTLTVTRTGAANPLTFDVAQVSAIQIFAGAGDDQISLGSGVMAAYVNAGLGNDSVLGGGFADTLTGAGGKDTLRGGAGDDRLNGGTGNDSLTGDDGTDRLYGNENNDVLSGVAGVDRLFGGDGDDSLSGGSSNDKLYGEAGNDSLDGGNQNDLLEGGVGADTILGGNGDDTLLGGAGIDQLFGNAGIDTRDSDPSDLVLGIEQAQ
jgi:Ca2+-binding RTX toxin-like protein